ncbi:MAG: Na/Pi symporter [Boseongicola sp.]|nr:Na/Pi symporter [Boseongicola sp.]
MTRFGLAELLQSTTAFALLAAGIASGGYLACQTGLVIVLGADLGSALTNQILSFRLDWLVPLLLSAGGWMFLKLDERSGRQIGQILIGIAFILISLQFLRAAVDPIRDSAFLPYRRLPGARLLDRIHRRRGAYVRDARECRRDPDVLDHDPV